MPRLLRILGCLVLTGLAVSIMAAGFAYGATPLPTAGAHGGLGAALSMRRVAPKVVALDADPASADLRAWAVAPGDQGQVGSCVTWAIDYGMLGWYARKGGGAQQRFAPMYTYSQINGGVDEGAMPSDALQLAVAQGNDTRADYTQGDYDWQHQPNAAERANAARYKIKGYASLFVGSDQAGAVTAVKHAIATMRPVAIEMAVRHGFDYLDPSPAAVDNDVSSTVRGYHEVLAVGYDGAGLIVENSWGTGWANGGFGRISWQVVQHDVWEADTIDGFVTAPAPPTPPTTSAPTITKIATGTAPTTSTTAYKVTWKGAPGSDGAITRYDVWSQVDGKAFARVSLASATSTSFVLTAVVGHHYRVAVRAGSSTSVGALQYSAAFVATR